MSVEIRYDGKILPQDAAPISLPKASPDIFYQGSVLPSEAKKFTPIQLDPSNQPNLVVLSTNQSDITPYIGTTYTPPVIGDILPSGAIVLPGDVLIKGYVEKILADTTIIDGVEVTEHIRRSPIYLELEFVVRAKQGNEWIFGQIFLEQLFEKIILPPSVIYIGNTLLNRLGIYEIVIRKGEFETVRGNINMPSIIRCKENIPGKSLIVPLGT